MCTFTGLTLPSFYPLWEHCGKGKGTPTPTLDGWSLVSWQSAGGWHSHEPDDNLALLSAKPVVTLPATERHHPLASTKLYCLVTETLMCYTTGSKSLRDKETAERVEPWPLDYKSDVLTTSITPPRYVRSY